MIAITPKSKMGKWSIYLMVAMPLLFILGSFFTSLYSNVPASDTIIQDFMKRPLLAISMFAGICSGIAAFVTGIVAFSKQKERSLLIYISMLIGAFLIFFLIGEFISPH